MPQDDPEEGGQVERRIEQGHRRRADRTPSTAAGHHEQQRAGKIRSHEQQMRFRGLRGERGPEDDGERRTDYEDRLTRSQQRTECGMQVVCPLPATQAGFDQRTVEQHQAHVVHHPPESLSCVDGHSCRRRPDGYRSGVVDAGPAAGMNLIRGMNVLADVPFAESTCRFKCGPTVKCSVAGGESTSVPVLRRLEGTVEYRFRVVQHVEATRIETLGGADEPDFRIMQVADQLFSDIRYHKMIGVESQDRVAVGTGQRVVEVAGLSRRAVNAGEARHTEAGRERVDFAPVLPAGYPAVVENIGPVRIVDGQRTAQRLLDHRRGFATHRHEDVKSTRGRTRTASISRPVTTQHHRRPGERYVAQ